MSATDRVPIMSQPRSYEDYEQEYNTILSRIRAFLASTRSISTLHECQRLITDAKRCVHAMLGIAEVNYDNIRIQKAKRCLEQEIEPLSSEIDRCLAEKNSGNVVSSNKQDLFNGAARTDNNNNANDFNRLLYDSNVMIRESQTLCHESEQVANNTLETMNRQRTQLQNANENLNETLEATDQAGELMKEMSRKTLKNKIFLYAIIVLLAIADLYALFRIFTK